MAELGPEGISRKEHIDHIEFFLVAFVLSVANQKVFWRYLGGQYG